MLRLSAGHVESLLTLACPVEVRAALGLGL
jgi:hypothetical protein